MRSQQLLEVAELLAQENAQLKVKLDHAQSHAANLERRLSLARGRVENLIARLPETASSASATGGR